MYERLAEESPALLAVVDDEGRFLWANRSWTKHLGWDPDALRGRAFDELVHPDDLDDVHASPVDDGSAKPQQRARLRHHDGGWRVVDWFVDAFSRGLFYAREVSEVATAEERLDRKLQILDLVEEIASVGHWQLSASTGKLTWSPQTDRIFGRDHDGAELTIADAVARFHPDDRARVSRALADAVESGQPFAFEARLMRPDGVERRLVARGRSAMDLATRHPRAVFGTFLDVTERDQERERLARERRLVTVGTLAAGVGHEMNNPLTFITSNLDEVVEELQLMSGASPTGRQRAVLDRLGEVRRGVERLTRIVRGLRAFAREDSPPRPTALHTAIELSVDMVAHEVRHRATCVVERAEVPLVDADESRIAQVMVNLLANAAQSFPTSDPERNVIVVRARCDGDDHVVVTVSDNGPGIPPDVLSRIFDPFFTTKAPGQGTGLGLAISLSVVHSVGGELTCASTVGVGTTFEMRLRRARRKVDTRPPAAPVAAHAEHVVVVDDEQSLAEGVARILRREGYRVVAYNDPRKALASFEVTRPDVILCDLVMPHLSGIEFYQRVAELHPELAPRFVFMCGGMGRADVRAFFEDADRERVDKPFTIAQLRVALRRVLTRSQRERGGLDDDSTT